jgi:transcriptional regulator with XRE-family HTH domain
MTQQCLAEKIGVNASYIGPLEKGLKCPSISVLLRLSDVLEQPIFSFFLDDSGDEAVDSTSQRIAAMLASHPNDEKAFLLKMLEEMSLVLRARH